MKKSPKSESASTYLTKTTHEVLSQLRDAEFFSVIDAKRGYWHILLDEARSYLTTCNSPFGLVVSQDVFQKHLDSTLQALKGVTGIVDATFVYGVTEEEHDASMVNLMTRSKERGIKTKTNKMTPPKNRQIFLPHMHAHDTQGD